MNLTHDTGPWTRAIHGGLEPDPVTGAILTPIHQTTTYVQDAIGIDRGHTYSRASNPTVSALERAIGALEDAGAIAFRTGMAATTTLLLSELSAGDHVVVSDVVYGGTVRLIREVLARLGVTASFVDTSDAAGVAGALRPETRLVFVETPANPTLKLSDIQAISEITRDAGIPLAVDNTFLTAVLQPALDLGADVAVYSTTKYIEGHNATVGGAITSRDTTLLARLARARKTLGGIQAPQDAWLTLRGLKTLPLRLQRHTENATIVARWLDADPRIARVHFPGLPSFPQYELAQRQHVAHGGLIAFEVRGGTPAALAALNAFELCALAESLGAVETLVTHPVTMTHGDVPREQREAAGITDGLIRLSVGLEHPGDIIADIDRALDARKGARHACAS